MQTHTQTPASSTAATPAAGTGGTIHLAASADYTEHQHTELHGFAITDATHGRINNSAPEHELIWVGVSGEGRWLRPEAVLELAAALEHMAHAHIERIAREQLAGLSA